MITYKAKECVLLGVVAATVTGGLWIAKYLYSKKVAGYRLRKLEQTWNEKRDVVIIHSIPRAKTAPHFSAFVIKLETYCRITGIPYELDSEVPFGSKGKTPWVTYNGESLTDSQLILEYLTHKLNKPLGKYSESEKSIGRAVRIMMEEHFYWGLGLWRYVYGDWRDICKILNMPESLVKEMYKGINKRVLNNAWAQGIGRHSQETVIKQMKDDLLAVSKILGNKKFLLGDEPCEDDCSVFGFLIQVLYCAPESPHELYVKGELQNLVSYCNRIKELYWPDWDQCVA